MDKEYRYKLPGRAKRRFQKEGITNLISNSAENSRGMKSEK